MMRLISQHGLWRLAWSSAGGGTSLGVNLRVRMVVPAPVWHDVTRLFPSSPLVPR